MLDLLKAAGVVIVYPELDDLMLKANFLKLSDPCFRFRSPFFELLRLHYIYLMSRHLLRETLFHRLVSANFLLSKLSLSLRFA